MNVLTEETEDEHHPWHFRENLSQNAKPGPRDLITQYLAVGTPKHTRDVSLTLAITITVNAVLTSVSSHQ